ncbi:hypothetical protein K438DRAFT_1759326 [Mycena galopus ATCC 62051]|nr:hypothetical protein K438DRAFT_1759326 [Mycena galopus ATCC 62051]
MPPGRKPLDAATKQEHRRLSSALYEAKNADKRRKAAKLRMQCHRAAIANSDYNTRRNYRAQAADHSDQYRQRKHQEERVESNRAAVVKHKARKLEADALRASHQLAAVPSRAPRPKRARMGHRPSPNHRGNSDNGDAEGSDSSQESDTPRCQLDETFFPARITPRTEVGRPCKTCRCGLTTPVVISFQTARNVAARTVQGVLVYASIRRLSWSTADIFIENASYLLRCNILLEPRASSSRMSLQNFPPSPGLLLCEPIYAPDPGHENRLTHNAFFAVMHEDWMGVVTSERTTVRMLNAYPQARTFRASTWSRFDDLWNQDCTEYHDHPNAIPTPASKLPSPRNLGELPTEDARNRERVIRENIDRNLGRTGPPLVSTDAERADTTPSEVPAGTAERPGAAEIADGISAMTMEAPPTYYDSYSTFNGHAHARTCLVAGISAEGEGVERGWGNTSARRLPPMLYAASIIMYGIGCLSQLTSFAGRDRATAVLEGTPGAELAFSRNAQELLCFLNTDEDDDDMPRLEGESDSESE